MIRARTDSIFSSARERGAKRNSKSIAGQHCSIILLDGRDLQLEINVSTMVWVWLISTVVISYYTDINGCQGVVGLKLAFNESP